jgi:glucose-6-phosphate 1-epimerase
MRWLILTATTMIIKTTSLYLFLALLTSVHCILSNADNVTLSIPGTKAKVVVHLYGATILSWSSTGGKPLLFMSSKAVMNGSQAIRGGIPIVFPQFNKNGILPQHGFARVSRWTLGGVTTKLRKTVKAFLTLTPAAIPVAQRLLWPFGNFVE